MSLEADVADLQNRIADAQKARIRAEAARDAALAAAETARAELQHDFGVTTADEAENLLNALRGELAEIAAGVADALDKIGV